MVAITFTAPGFSVSTYSIYGLTILKLLLIVLIFFIKVYKYVVAITS